MRKGTGPRNKGGHDLIRGGKGWVQQESAARAGRNSDRGRGIDALNSLPQTAEDPRRKAGKRKPLAGRPTAIVDDDKCTMCGRCMEICPVRAITVDSMVNIDTGECLECGKCVSECPHEAITIQHF